MIPKHWYYHRFSSASVLFIHFCKMQYDGKNIPEFLQERSNTRSYIVEENWLLQITLLSPYTLLGTHTLTCTHTDTDRDTHRYNLLSSYWQWIVAEGGRIHLFWMWPQAGFHALLDSRNPCTCNWTYGINLRKKGKRSDKFWKWGHEGCWKGM